LSASLVLNPWCTHHVLNHSNPTKNEEVMMGLELKKGLKLFFQKNWSKLLLIFFLCFMHCSFILDSFTSNVQRTFVTF
jgi:hypothetical protein